MTHGPHTTPDPPDFDELWSAHRGSVIRYTTGLLNGDQQAAEDVTQETALRLWQRPETASRPGSLHGWLFTVARRIIIDRERRRSARPAETFAASITDIGVPSTGDDIADDTVSRMTADALLDYLPAPQRAAVEAVYVDGCSVRQAAERIGIPVGTVKSRCHHGLDKLRRHLLADDAELAAAA